MAKDRFSNQKKSNYNKEFRYGASDYSPKIKKNKVFTSEQKKFINEILNNKISKLNEWEKDFLIVLSTSMTYSDKQKLHLEKIITKIKNK